MASSSNPTDVFDDDAMNADVDIPDESISRKRSRQSLGDPSVLSTPSALVPIDQPPKRRRRDRSGRKSGKGRADLAPSEPVAPQSSPLASLSSSRPHASNSDVQHFKSTIRSHDNGPSFYFFKFNCLILDLVNTHPPTAGASNSVPDSFEGQAIASGSRSTQLVTDIGLSLSICS